MSFVGKTMSKKGVPEYNFYDAHLAQGTKQFLCSDLVNRMFLLVLASGLPLLNCER